MFFVALWRMHDDPPEDEFDEILDDLPAGSRRRTHYTTKYVWGGIACLQIMHTTLLEIPFGFSPVLEQPHR